MQINEQTKTDSRPPLFGLFSVIRYVVGTAAIGIVIGSTVLMLLGVFGVVAVLYFSLTGADVGVLDELRIALIEATDLFLVSTTLYVIAAGLFQLFVNPNSSRHFPTWLRVDGLHALEDRMIGMVVAVSCVVFLTLLMEWHGQFDIMAAGIGVGSVIAAASLFVYAGGRRNHSSDKNHDEGRSDD